MKPTFRCETTNAPGVKLIQRTNYADLRGEFGKIFNEDTMREFGLPTTYPEVIYSISGKNVIRGMHYQEDPYSVGKLVTVLSGAIEDVVIYVGKDKDIPQGLIYSTILTSQNKRSIYIPKGYAHGFKSLEEGTIVCYLQTGVYKQESDKGYRWDTIGYDWKIKNPIVSKKDESLPILKIDHNI